MASEPNLQCHTCKQESLSIMSPESIGNVRVESGTGKPVLEELEPEQPITRTKLVEPQKKTNADQISTHRCLISISKMSRRDRHDGQRFSNSYVLRCLLHTAIVQRHSIYSRRKHRHPHSKTAALWQAGRSALQRNLQKL